jgi:sigma-E factor negative regulatory protein RseA
MKYEEVSAFVDGEIPAQNCAPLIDQVSINHNARQTWGRYHLIGDAIRSHNFADNRAAEPVNYRASPPSVLRFRKPLIGLAIAASVAVLAVTFILSSEPQLAKPGFEIAEHVQSGPLAPAPISSLTTAPASNVVSVGAYDHRLNGYLVNFNEQRSRLGVPGVHPYVRIIGFEAE